MYATSPSQLVDGVSSGLKCTCGSRKTSRGRRTLLSWSTRIGDGFAGFSEMRRFQRCGAGPDRFVWLPLLLLYTRTITVLLLASRQRNSLQQEHVCFIEHNLQRIYKIIKATQNNIKIKIQRSYKHPFR